MGHMGVSWGKEMSRLSRWEIGKGLIVAISNYPSLIPKSMHIQNAAILILDSFGNYSFDRPECSQFN